MNSLGWNQAGSRLFLNALVLATGCSSGPCGGVSAANSGTTATTTVALTEGGVFASQAYRFLVRYPHGTPPTFQDLGTVETAIGPIHEISYYAGVGETAYDITVSVYPPDTLSTDIIGLLKVTRDKALEAPGARLLEEHATSVRTSRGENVQAYFIAIDMPQAHAFRVTCFHKNHGFNIGVAGASARRSEFDEFLSSFQLLVPEAP